MMLQKIHINGSKTKKFQNVIMKCVSAHLGYIYLSERFLKFTFKKIKHSKLQNSTEVAIALHVFNI